MEKASESRCRECRHYEAIRDSEGFNTSGFCTNDQTKDLDRGLVIGFVSVGALACSFFESGASARIAVGLSKVLEAPTLGPGVVLERRIEFSAGRMRVQEKMIADAREPERLTGNTAVMDVARAFTKRMLSSRKGFGQLVLRFQTAGTALDTGVLIRAEATPYPQGGKVT